MVVDVVVTTTITIAITMVTREEEASIPTINKVTTRFKPSVLVQIFNFSEIRQRAQPPKQHYAITNYELVANLVDLSVR